MVAEASVLNILRRSEIRMTAQQALADVDAFLSVDLGRTSTKTCVSLDPDKVVLIPANVKHLPVKQVQRKGFGSNLADPLLDMWLEYQEEGYALGQLALDFGADLGLERSNDALIKSKVKDAVVKVFGSIGYFNKLKGKKLALVLALPYESQERFDEEGDKLVETLQTDHLMFYRGESFRIDIKRVWVVPEGYGSLIWCGTQKNLASFLDLSVAVVDIGHQTSDFVMVDRFRFARGASRSKPLAMNTFYERVAEEVKNGIDSQSPLLMKAVHQPKGQRIYRPQGSRKRIDLDRILPRIRQNFAQELTKELIDWLPERATDVVISGGGGEFFWNDLEVLLKEAGLLVHLATPSRKANALGQQVYGRLKAWQEVVHPK